MSGVAATVADREVGEWYPRTKFIADFLKENGETKLVGEGRMWYHKTLNANNLRENDKTKLAGEGHKQYHKADEVGWSPNPNPNPDQPCIDEVTAYVDCMGYAGVSEDEISACMVCLDEAIKEDKGNFCVDMEENGYCLAVATCEANECNNECTVEINTAQTCIAYYNGCVGNEFESECLSGM